MITATSLGPDFQMEFTDGERTALSDTTAQWGGGGQGFKPHDLLEAALANCIGITVRMYAQKHGLALEGVSVRVSLDRQDPEKPVFRYGLELRGDLDEGARDRIMRAARACSVHKLLTKPLGFEQE